VWRTREYLDIVSAMVIPTLPKVSKFQQYIDEDFKMYATAIENKKPIAVAPLYNLSNFIFLK
jgi:hypothetical protein